MKCYNCSKETNQEDICPHCKKSQIYTTLSFNAVGVTFKNEEGKDIQKEIRKIFLDYEKNGCFEKYGGYTNSEIIELSTEISEFEDAEVEMLIKEDIYENEPCMKIYIKRYDDTYCHIGYMPKKLVKTYLKLKENFKEIKTNINLTGGKIKQLEYDYESDKEKVETIDLTYGFEINLILYNDKNKFQEEVKKESKKQIEKWKELREQEEKKKKEEEEKNKEKEKKERNNSRIGLILYLGLCVLSFFIMPIGIITLIIGVIGTIACMSTAF